MNEVPVGTACSERASEAELMKRLDEVLGEYRGKPGALIPVLQTAQGIFGFLPEKAMKRIALGLGKSYSEVAGVVGFYSFFSTVPRGRHLIRVCLGTACYVRGGKQLLEAFKQELGCDVGGTTEDGLFSLEVARCFGACGLAPTVMIDEDVLQRVKAPKVREILDAYRGGNGNGSGARKGKSAAGNGSARKTPSRKKTASAGKTGAAARKRTPARAGAKTRKEAVAG
jgi:NADH:ubiquinone oxidoreductase subunit E